MALILNRHPGRRVALMIDGQLLGYVEPRFNKERPGTVDLHFDFDKTVCILREELLTRAADDRAVGKGVGETSKEDY